MMHDDKEFEYSIMVRQHYKHKHRYCGYGFVTGIKQDGIYESASKIKMIKTKKEMIDEMTRKFQLMTLPRYGEDGV